MVREFLPAFLTDGSFYLLVFTLTHVLDAAGASSDEVALVFGIYTLAYALVAPILGSASDARGRRRIVIGGAALFSGVALALSLLLVIEGGPAGTQVRVRTGWGLQGWVYGGIALMALANALFWPALQAGLGDRARAPQALGRAIRRFNLGWTSGKALGFLAAGFLYASAPQLCLPLVCCGGLGVVVCLLWGRDVPGGPEAAESPGQEPRTSPPELVRTEHPRATKRAFLIAALLANFLLWGTLATLKSLAPKLGAALDLEVSQRGVLLFAALTAQALGFLALGRGSSWAYRPASLALALPLALLGLGLLYGSGGLVVAALGAACIGLAQALTYTASVFYSLDYDERRGWRTGIHEAVLGLGGALPIVGGAVDDAGGGALAPLVMMFGLGLVGAFVVGALLAGARRARPAASG